MTARRWSGSKPASSWEQRAQASRRWASWGAALGVVGSAVAYAPAQWVAQAVQSATSERLALTQARGSLWHGSAVLMLTGGPGSRDATVLPGRLEWSLRPQWSWQGPALNLTLHQDCCLWKPLTVHMQPGWGRWTWTLPAAPATAGGWGQWPATWLSGLGTPFNTLDLDGTLRVASPGAQLQWANGRWHMSGELQLDVEHMSSRLSTLDTLGQYRLILSGGSGAGPQADAPTGAGATLTLSTLSGALRINGQGRWVDSRFQFKGEAFGAEGAEGAVNNLLNLIGRREGARALISIG